MTFLRPIWLVLAIPLILSLWMWPLPSRMLRVLRFAMIVLLVLSLAGLSILWPRRAGTVVVVSDLSLSVPDGKKESLGVIDLVEEGMESGEKLAVVSFGRKVVVEQNPRSTPFTEFTGAIGPDGSHLTQALEKALTVIPKGAPGRVLVVSDGRWTGRPPESVISQATSRGIAIDFRPVERSQADDLAVARIQTPASVTAKEAFLVNAWVHSPVKQKVQYRLYRDNKIISQGVRLFSSGQNRLTFRDQADNPGTLSYELKVQGEGTDPVPENNRARILVGIKGRRSVLLVSNSENRALEKMLKKGKLDVQQRSPGQCSWTLEALSNYSAVILENIPSQDIGKAGMETLAAWVQESGAGLMMTGGFKSYSLGGYYQSPLDPILPISMELKQKHRKLQLAIVVTLDRSGSMNAPAGGGKVKMDLANLGTAQVLEMLSPVDEMGVLAVDSRPHEIQPVGPIKDKDAVRKKILSIRSMGGGIFVNVALRKSMEMLESAKAGTKHIILFADAADAERPGNYADLLQECETKGITVSVIGLGQKTHRDGKLLEDIALRGKGRCFFTTSAEELPRLFAQDTFVVARSSFVKTQTKVKVTAGMSALTGAQLFQYAPPIDGYNLCTLRKEANLAGVTVDEHKAPLMTSWQAGEGRVVCYTGEVDGPNTGPIGDWDQFGDMMTSLTRWVAGQKGELPNNSMLTQEIRQGMAVVQYHLDPERDKETFSGLPTATILRASPGETPAKETRTLRWTDPDTLTLEVPLQTSDTALTTVNIPDHGAVSLTPVCLPYSPEYRPVDKGLGIATLYNLAQATGGQERLDLKDIWDDLPKQPIMQEISTWLLLALLVLLLLEVLERRTAILSYILNRIPAALSRIPRFKLSARPAKTASPSPVVAAAAPDPDSLAKRQPEPPKLKPKPVQEPDEEGGLLGALKKTRKKTGRK